MYTKAPITIWDNGGRKKKDRQQWIRWDKKKGLWWKIRAKKVTFELLTEGADHFGTPNMFRKIIPSAWARNTKTVIVVYCGLVHPTIEWNQVLL